MSHRGSQVSRGLVQLKGRHFPFFVLRGGAGVVSTNDSNTVGSLVVPPDLCALWGVGGVDRDG